MIFKFQSPYKIYLKSDPFLTTSITMSPRDAIISCLSLAQQSSLLLTLVPQGLSSTQQPDAFLDANERSPPCSSPSNHLSSHPDANPASSHEPVRTHSPLRTVPLTLSTTVSLVSRICQANSILRNALLSQETSFPSELLSNSPPQRKAFPDYPISPPFHCLVSFFISLKCCIFFIAFMWADITSVFIMTGTL